MESKNDKTNNFPPDRIINYKEITSLINGLNKERNDRITRVYFKSLVADMPLFKLPEQYVNSLRELKINNELKQSLKNKDVYLNQPEIMETGKNQWRIKDASIEYNLEYDPIEAKITVCEHGTVRGSYLYNKDVFAETEKERKAKEKKAKEKKPKTLLLESNLKHFWTSHDIYKKQVDSAKKARKGEVGNNLILSQEEKEINSNLEDVKNKISEMEKELENLDDNKHNCFQETYNKDYLRKYSGFTKMNKYNPEEHTFFTFSGFRKSDAGKIKAYKPNLEVIKSIIRYYCFAKGIDDVWALNQLEYILTDEEWRDAVKEVLKSDVELDFMVMLLRFIFMGGGGNYRGAPLNLVNEEILGIDLEQLIGVGAELEKYYSLPGLSRFGYWFFYDNFARDIYDNLSFNKEEAKVKYACALLTKIIKWIEGDMFVMYGDEYHPSLFFLISYWERNNFVKHKTITMLFESFTDIFSEQGHHFIKDVINDIVKSKYGKNVYFNYSDKFLYKKEMKKINNEGVFIDSNNSNVEDNIKKYPESYKTWQYQRFIDVYNNDPVNFFLNAKIQKLINGDPASFKQRLTKIEKATLSYCGGNIGETIYILGDEIREFIENRLFFELLETGKINEKKLNSLKERWEEYIESRKEDIPKIILSGIDIIKGGKIARNPEGWKDYKPPEDSDDDLMEIHLKKIDLGKYNREIYEFVPEECSKDEKEFLDKYMDKYWYKKDAYKEDSIYKKFSEKNRKWWDACIKILEDKMQLSSILNEKKYDFEEYRYAKRFLENPFNEIKTEIKTDFKKRYGEISKKEFKEYMIKRYGGDFEKQTLLDGYKKVLLNVLCGDKSDKKFAYICNPDVLEEWSDKDIRRTQLSRLHKCTKEFESYIKNLLETQDEKIFGKTLGDLITWNDKRLKPDNIKTFY
ncbi:MAG: hypothetical protein A7315_06865 [Candidatus Altiarchaeales archaeon WOR_SM1_79]|nr:MAG: hypothetical protein A7315_06865 [Candidatus Altiarchaeales archaeon WOR_SM1_79]